MTRKPTRDAEPESPIRSQAVLIVTMLADGQTRLTSFGSPDLPTREAEDLTDQLAKLFATILKHPVPPPEEPTT